MIKNKLKNIKKWFIKDFNYKKVLISSCISLLVFVLIFPTGALSNGTTIEVCSYYFTNISSNYTVYDGNKKISGLIVESKEWKQVDMDTDTTKAIDSLWGVFKGTNASFAPVMNANKSLNFRFVDPGYTTNSLSILYSDIGCGDSTVGYHTEQGDVYVDYKFQCSPLATMFQSSRTDPNSKLHIYISQSMAERYLTFYHKQVSLEAFQSFRNKEVDIDFNGELRTCIIDNIYLDNFKHECQFPYKDHNYDYYYGTDVGTILGDYIFIYFHGIERTAVPQCFKKQGLYFMSEYAYRNSFYLEYAKKIYNPTDFSYDFATNNLKNNFVPNSKVLTSALNNGLSTVWCLLVTILIILLFLFNLLFMYRHNLLIQPLSVSIILSISFVPYLLFRLIFAFSHVTYLFSSYSLMFTLILFVTLAFTILILNCFGRKLIWRRRND